MKKNHKGFSVVEALLVIIIVGIIGFLSWYVVHARNATNNQLPENNDTSVIENEKPEATTQQSEQTTDTPKSSTSYKVGETFVIKIDGPYWGDLSFSSKSATQVSKQGVNCKPEFGCEATNYIVKALARGTVTITATRTQCGEALACQNGAGTHTETITIE